MNRRSLLDYIPENVTADEGPSEAQVDAARMLERRLAELESRLTAAQRSDDAPVESGNTDNTFSSQIEAILKRRAALPEQVAQPSRPVREPSRIAMQAPPLAPELGAPETGRSAEFTKFVEAVHLIGQAANRFLHAPEPRSVAVLAPRPAEAVDKDTIRLTLALKDTVAALQAVSTTLADAASEIRQASVERARPVAEPRATSRPVNRVDDELMRLQDDLEGLRERLAALNRRRNRDGY